MKLIILFLFIIKIGIPVANAQGSSAPVVPTNTASSSSGNNESLDVLRARLELTEKFNDKILSTIYWSIGTTTALFSLVLGFQWFSSYRLAQKDKEALFARINEVLLAAGKDLESKSEAAKDLLRKELNLEIEKIRAELAKQPDNLKASESKLSDKISSLTQSLEKKLEKLGKETSYSFAEIELARWNESKIYTNSLRRLLEMLNICIDLAVDWRVSRVLDMIHDLFKNTSMKVDAALSGDTLQTLQRLNDRHHIMRDSIIRELQKSKA